MQRPSVAEFEQVPVAARRSRFQSALSASISLSANASPLEASSRMVARSRISCGSWVTFMRYQPT